MADEFNTVMEFALSVHDNRVQRSWGIFDALKAVKVFLNKIWWRITFRKDKMLMAKNEKASQIFKQVLYIGAMTRMKLEEEIEFRLLLDKIKQCKCHMSTSEPDSNPEQMLQVPTPSPTIDYAQLLQRIQQNDDRVIRLLQELINVRQEFIPIHDYLKAIRANIIVFHIAIARIKLQLAAQNAQEQNDITDISEDTTANVAGEENGDQLTTYEDIHTVD